ncbi:exodeoxyribonuclease 7 large subunit [Siccirubricoccus deserti]|uniref:Exodeoxyribonuclease 7 large subunit n=1 Tax=Siccirubricoccus deserti TaxID=2013562 RepID=A0A9X0UCJ3_9PROT|nr:exodeoxyribonuclease VII large subunit [Siccirubricoccus deserti]MBC4014516.1 exodeoxyribonuclease VII large subunit [Siccirubricoccus deserti]GGC32302.1 exodeoxyribonuclease 7 large subunit [Siccirubricoccus deserti]
MDSTPPRAATANIPEFAVSELAGAIRRTLEGAFGRVRVRGEITELRRYPSGHIYLALKDENAKLKGVIWKGTVARLGLKPEEGVEVIATGKITTYGDRSEYQLVIDRLEYAGAGALLARIETLRLKLLEEGLFAPERKRRLPLLPRVIGVVTSERGAVIQDIRTTIARRFPRRLILWPVAVQGAGAAEQIAAAIRGFGALPAGGAVPRPDVIIVARGGGSLEDLMAFNEEIVVRAAAESPIPLISAVGHETDTTLIDFASDRRAPTPTAAAEIAIPARADLLADLAQRQARLLQLGRAITERARRRLMMAERGLPDLPNILGALRQRLEDRGERLGIAMPALLERRRAALGRIAPKLPHPREQIAARRAALAMLAARAETAWHRAQARRKAAAPLARFSATPVQALLREKRVRLEGLAARLGSVSYQAVLARGFALVQDAEGAPLTTAAAVPPGGHLTLTFADGQIGATADGAKPTRRKRDMPSQGALL